MIFKDVTVHISVTKEQLLYCFLADTTEEFDRRIEQLANDMHLKIEKELFKELIKEAKK